MSQERYKFFCWSLKEGALFAGHFTSIISMISCALALAVLFRESDANDTNSKLLSFVVACYSVFYIVMSRSLLRGIKNDRRDLFVCWIVMSITTVTLLISGIIYIGALFFTGKLVAKNNTYMTVAVFVTTVLSVFLTGLLVYCIWGVVTLWRLYGGGNAEGETV